MVVGFTIHKIIEYMCPPDERRNYGMGFARLNGPSGNNYVKDNIHHQDLGGYNFAQEIWSQLKNIPLFFTAVPT